MKTLFIFILLLGALMTDCRAEESADKKLSAAVRAELRQLTSSTSSKSPEPDTAPASAASRERTYLVTLQSPSNIEGVTQDLASLVSKVTRHAMSVLSIETKQQLPLLTALIAHQKVGFVEESTERINEPIVTSSVVPFNYNANLTHNVLALRKLYDLSGEGVTVGLWDEGPVLSSHAEFTGRVEVRDPGEPNAHATHVAGTIAAAGVAEDQQAGGMAPKVHVISYDYNNDLNKIESVLGGIAPPQVTNHSYTSRRGWSPAGNWLWCGAPAVSETEDYLFGKYSTDSAAIDDIALRHPNTSIFVAAGNQRSETLDPHASAGWDGRHWVPQLHDYSNAKRPSNAQHDGYDTLEGFGLAKNVITVGAMEDVSLGVNTVTAESVRVTKFSSWGPADDGRIKPDLIANGAQLNSPTVQWLVTGFDNHAYQQMSGTSQATPAASGIGALLVELSEKRRNKPLRSDELKAALIHTAVSPFQGPTYQIGWGAIDAEAAGKLVAGDSGKLLTVSLVNQQPLRFKGKAFGESIRVTVAWIDPAGKPNAAGLNDRQPARVMDIKLFLADNRGAPHYPWSLDPNNPTAGAKRTGWNERDNVQRVDVDGPVSGDWTVELGGSGLSGQPTIALAISGLILDE
ncbi:S8 family serine peptidase [Bradyrhizobium sp. NBAIM01]|uniref:S8 family serine peptidase n=1 Tax=Bradyrhizobium sp. NBAIM01 TaxID=2793818 RepID=UPI001CD72034|nr:S8 family serine peptidase [Bradyrhizobium sp. NBAIM01]MCA1510217.1 S8 family serine peptidase [Bradyrhizobium sp. NBAIM01]